jgi:hypothetical protein
MPSTEVMYIIQWRSEAKGQFSSHMYKELLKELGLRSNAVYIYLIYLCTYILIFLYKTDPHV